VIPRALGRAGARAPLFRFPGSRRAGTRRWRGPGRFVAIGGEVVEIPDDVGATVPTSRRGRLVAERRLPVDRPLRIS
jgi:hypothetical protein